MNMTKFVLFCFATIITFLRISGNVVPPTDPSPYDYDYTTGETEINEEMEEDTTTTVPKASIANLNVQSKSTSTIQTNGISRNVTSTASTTFTVKTTIKTFKNNEKNNTEPGLSNVFIPPFVADNNYFPIDLPSDTSPPPFTGPDNAKKSFTLVFFQDNWLWILLGVLGITLFFCIPGMVVQIFCHKFYGAYRREKVNGEDEEGTPKLIKSRKLLTSDTMSGGSDSFSQESDSFDDPISEKSSIKSRPGKISAQSHQSLVSEITPARTRSNTTGTKPSNVDLNPQRQESPNSGSLRRVDVYTGPPALPFSFFPPPELPPKMSRTPTTSSLDDLPPPFIPPKNSRSYNISSFPTLTQPQDFNIESRFAQNRLTSADDAKNAPEFDLMPQSNSLLEQRPPALPPKPKQYRIRPPGEETRQASKPRDKRRSVQPSEKTAEKPARQTKKQPRSTRTSSEQINKPVKSTKNRHGNETDAAREHRRRTNSKSQGKVKRQSTSMKESEINAKKLEQLHKQEDLLRQILQGISEAELLKAKLQETKNRAKDQEALEIKQTKPERKRSKQPARREEKRRTKSSRIVKEDRPPSYTRSITPN